METYIIILYCTKGTFEKTVCMGKYPMESDIANIFDIHEDDIISYEVHY